MEYLGHTDYLKLYKLLFLEQNEYIKGITVKEFKENQVKILKEYNFYTASARRFCEVSKEEQLKKVREDDWE